MNNSSLPIWKLVQQCAEDLTRNGTTPFTRADLVRCVQSKDPSRGSDSINPIIQGLTDNLRGGAPGAVGKDILHSVGRGLFVLKGDTQGQARPPGTMKPAAVQAQGTRGQEQPGGFASPPIQTSGGPLLRLGVYDFRHVCAISPVREQDGSVREYLPQTGSANAEGLPLHKYGRGPFCKFTIPANLEVPGVYALVARGQVLYIGECAGLSSRYNMGYGNISPRNCFVGGQQTNCRINNLILQQAKAGAGVDLWFNETNNYKAIEQELREAFRPSWNRV